MENNTTIIEKIEDTFLADVVKGLSSSPKSLSSKYFYNEEGDRLFQKIMGLKEYYLTRAEFEIIETNRTEICKIFSTGDAIDVIELGAGDGIKTRLLLEELVNHNIDFNYYPVDISANALEVVSTSLRLSFPSISVIPVQDEYFSALGFLGRVNNRKKVVLFLGANIGNLNNEEVKAFLKGLNKNLQNGDVVFIGIDLKKNPETILAAYNDESGVTAAFNFNLLKRINNELDADFNLDSFIHSPTYDSQSGETKSYLESKFKQTVYIKAADLVVHLEEGERVQTELSKKYSLDEVEKLSAESNFQVIENFHDHKKYFLNTVWRKHN